MSREQNARSSRLSRAVSRETGRRLPPDGATGRVAGPGDGRARPTSPSLDARAGSVRPRLLDHDDGCVPAAAPAPLHRFRWTDRRDPRRRGRLRARALARDRPLERRLPHAARAPAPVHARSAGPDGLLPAADAVHAEPLDDDRHRPLLLLRLLPVRTAVPRPLPGCAAGDDVRPLTGRAAHPARDRDRPRARRWRLVVQALASVAVSTRLATHDDSVR